MPQATIGSPIDAMYILAIRLFRMGGSDPSQAIVPKPKNVWNS